MNLYVFLDYFGDIEKYKYLTYPHLMRSPNLKHSTASRSEIRYEFRAKKPHRILMSPNNTFNCLSFGHEYIHLVIYVCVWHFRDCFIVNIHDIGIHSRQFHYQIYLSLSNVNTVPNRIKTNTFCMCSKILAMHILWKLVFVSYEWCYISYL